MSLCPLPLNPHARSQLVHLEQAYIKEVADPVFGVPDSPASLAFTLRIAEFRFKRSYHKDTESLMFDVSVLTYFHQVASVSDVFDATEPWTPEFLHRLSVLAFLARSLIVSNSRSHVELLQALWPRMSVALLTYVRMRVTPTDTVRGPKLVGFLEEVYATEPQTSLSSSQGISTRSAPFLTAPTLSFLSLEDSRCRATERKGIVATQVQVK